MTAPALRTVDDTGIGDTRVVDPDTVPWVQAAPGLDLKILRVGAESGVYTMMGRFAPGTVLPKHRHMGCVHAWTISGRWGYREYDWEASAGQYVFEPRDSVHTLEVPADAAEPAVVMFVIEGGLVLMDEDDNLVGIQDARSMYAVYTALLEHEGRPTPRTILP